MIRCPECKTGHFVQVAVRCWAFVVDDGENVETEPADNDHEWDESSPFRCIECGRTGKLADFDSPAR